MRKLSEFFREFFFVFDQEDIKKLPIDTKVIQEVMNFGFLDLEASSRSGDYIFPGSFPTWIEKEGEHGDL